MLTEAKKGGSTITLDEYYKLREKSDHLLEYIDGVVFMTPSPSTRHQRISMHLGARLYNFLEGKECEVFHAPFDVELNNENMDGKKIVIPDLSVICDKNLKLIWKNFFPVKEDKEKEL